MYIAHAHNIFIGMTAAIGDNCKIYPGVGIYATVIGDHERSSHGIAKHAHIGNDCFLGANAIIIGNITIGDDVLVAAGATVTKNVPSHSVVKNVNEIRPKRQDEIPDKYKNCV